MEILRYGQNESEYIRKWIDSKKDEGSSGDKAVYYTLYNDVFEEPMEMYLYMPLAKEVMGDITLSNVRVNESGQGLVLNIDSTSNIKHTREGTDLILHVYVTGNPAQARAKTDRLFINGERYTCPSTTFARLR